MAFDTCVPGVASAKRSGAGGILYHLGILPGKNGNVFSDPYKARTLLNLYRYEFSPDERGFLERVVTEMEESGSFQADLFAPVWFTHAVTNGRLPDGWEFQKQQIRPD